MKNFSKIQTLLLSGPKAVSYDQSLFNSWARGDISTYKCLKLFRDNNRHDDRVDISLEEFEQWLASLGYRRM